MNIKAVAFLLGYKSPKSIEKTAARNISPGQKSFLKSIAPGAQINKEGEEEPETFDVGTVGSKEVQPIDTSSMRTGTDTTK